MPAACPPFALCILALVLALSVAGSALAQSADIRVGIHISADSPEALQAWRRALGLAAPDPVADAKWRGQTVALSAAAAARERRRQRTLELIAVDGAAIGFATGACAPLPSASDPCTRVVIYDPQARTVSITGR